MHLGAHREQESSISRGIFLLVLSTQQLLYTYLLRNDKFLGRQICSLSSTMHRESCEHRRGHLRAHTAHATVHLHSQEGWHNQGIGGIKELLPFSLSQVFGDFSSPCLSPNKSDAQGFQKKKTVLQLLFPPVLENNLGPLPCSILPPSTGPLL